MRIDNFNNYLRLFTFVLIILLTTSNCMFIKTYNQKRKEKYEYEVLKTCIFEAKVIDWENAGVNSYTVYIDSVNNITEGCEELIDNRIYFHLRQPFRIFPLKIYEAVGKHFLFCKKQIKVVKTGNVRWVNSVSRLIR